MKKILLMLLILAAYGKVYSQNSDLIVKSYIARNEVIENKHNAIDEKSFAIKPDTSVIHSPKKLPAAFDNFQKNSVYFGLSSINYSRMIPENRFRFTLSGGLNFIGTAFESAGIGFMLETTCLLGNTKHFFEPGIMLYRDNVWFGPVIRTGYRYQSAEGFLFRAGILFNNLDGYFIGLPTLSVGYSF